MKKQEETQIIETTKDYIKASKKHQSEGVLVRDVMKYIEEQGIQVTTDPKLFGRVLSSSKKFIKKLKWSSKYNQQLNHWFLNE